jgi:MFS family permease
MSPSERIASVHPAMTARGLLRLALVGLGSAIVPLDTAVNIGFPDITRSFGLPIAMIQWVVICYVLTYASLMLAFGRAGDVFGHARVFRIGLAWSTAAFLLCAAAPSYGWLLFCRFLQGIGAGLVISVAPALVTGLFPEERRSRALGAFTMMFAIGSAAGPLLGGVLVHFWGWPGVFWFRAPIALAALLLLEGLPPAQKAAEREPIDVLGAALLAFGIAALLLAVNRLQQPASGLALALPLLAVAFAALFAFTRWERRAPRPIVALALFRDIGFAAANLASVLVALTGFSVLLLGPYYLVRFTGLSLPAAGVLLAASFAGMMASSPLAGRIIERVPAEPVTALGAVISGAGLFAVGLWRPDMPLATATILATLVVQGVGIGLFQVSYTELVMRQSPRRHHGVAGSLALLTRTLGVVSGATLLTFLFHAVASIAAANGHDAAASFLAAFRTTFRIAGATAAASGILVLLAARIGRRGSGAL